MILNTIVPAAGKKICQTAANSSFAVTSAFFCNTSEEMIEILDLYLVAGSGTVGAQSKIVCKMQIKPTDTFALDTEKLILENGDYLYASSTNSNLSAVVSVMDLT